MTKEPTNNQDTEGREPNTLLHEDEVFRDGFTQVSNRVLRARNLSASAKTLYAILLSYSWQADKCFPGYARLCEDMQLSEKIVRKYMHELEGVKLLAQKRRGLGLTNIYILLSLKNATLDTASEAERDTPPDQERDRGNDPKRDTSPDKEYSSKNTQINNTKSFRKANAFKTEKGGEGVQASTHSHRERMATGKQNTRGVKNGITKQERQPAYVGKPLTQEEIDGKRRNGQNASGYTPLSQIPVSHWQELETRAAAATIHQNGNGNGLHFHQTTKNAPASIDASIEQLSALLHDEPANTAQNINRAAKLCREAGLDPEQFTSLLWSIYHEKIKHLPDKVVKTRRADGAPNKMLLFFAELEKALGLKEEKYLN